MDKKEEIKRCARELFSQKGFKDTGVSDITRMAGVAAGTFYIYYPSKDALFMDIFNEENVKLKQVILSNVDPDGDPGDVMRQMMFQNIQGIKAHPILREWFNREVFTKIERNFREQGGMGQVNFLYESFVEAVRKWQLEGKMRSDLSAEMIMAIFAAIINVDTHKDEVGFEYFPEVLEHISNFVMKGLTQPMPNTTADRGADIK